MTCPCGEPTSGASLCTKCAMTLAYAIANVATYYDDLRTVATKRTRYGVQGATKGSVGKSQPLPVDLRFVSGAPRLDVFGGVGGPTTAPGAQLQWDTWNTVVAWCRVVMDEQAQVLGPRCGEACLHVSCHVIKTRAWPRNTLRSMCHYLDRQHRWIEGRDWAPVLLDELLDLERRLVRMVNRPPDRWYAGKCSASDLLGVTCTAELYATEDHGTIVCPGCETRHDVGDRRDFLLEEAKHYLVTATEAAGALLAWTDYDGNEGKLIKLISQWHQHERLASRGETVVNGKDRRLYRLGDVQELLIRHAQREQQRRLGARDV